MTTIYAHHASPLGPILLVADRDAEGIVRLVGAYLPGHRRGPVIDPTWTADPAALAPVNAQLDEYFAGQRSAFDVPLAVRGTGFQQAVWAALREIPFGTTVAYAEIARRVGRPGAARAVGAAVARNPVSIVVPCHRVVGASGSLTGYAGGLERKSLLLDLERRAARLGTAAGSPAATATAPADGAAPAPDTAPAGSLAPATLPAA